MFLVILLKEVFCRVKGLLFQIIIHAAYNSKILISFIYWWRSAIFYLDILLQLLTRKLFQNFNLKTRSHTLIICFSSLPELFIFELFVLWWFFFFGWDLPVFLLFVVISAPLPLILSFVISVDMLSWCSRLCTLFPI